MVMLRNSGDKQGRVEWFDFTHKNAHHHKYCNPDRRITSLCEHAIGGQAAISIRNFPVSVRLPAKQTTVFY